MDLAGTILIILFAGFVTGVVCLLNWIEWILYPYILLILIILILVFHVVLFAQIMTLRWCGRQISKLVNKECSTHSDPEPTIRIDQQSEETPTDPTVQIDQQSEETPTELDRINWLINAQLIHQLSCFVETLSTHNDPASQIDERQEQTPTAPPIPQEPDFVQTHTCACHRKKHNM